MPQNPATAAYLAKDVDDECARRAVESTRLPPLDAADHAVIAISRTMDEWLEATDIELLDGPLVFSWDDEDDFERGWN